MGKYAVSLGNRTRFFVFDTDNHPFLKIERLDTGTNEFASKGFFSDVLGAFSPSAAGSPGAGDVTGPGSSTDNALVRFDGTTGKDIQNSGVTLDNSNNMANVASLEVANYTLIAHGVATLAAGSVTTALSAINANAIVILSRKTLGTAAGHLSYTVTASTNFTITSSSGTDDGQVAYQVWNQT